MGLRQFCIGLLVLWLCLGGVPAAPEASIRMDTSADILRRTTSMPAFGNLTRMLWLYMVADAGIDATTSYIADSSSLGAYIGMYVHATSLIMVQETTGLGINSAGGATALPMATWTHVAMVFDDTANTITVYLNGVVDASMAQTGVTGTTTWGYELLGSTTDAGGTNFFNGRYAAYKQFTIAMTQAQVRAEMLTFVPVNRVNLHSYCPFRTTTELTSYVGGGAWTAGGTLATEADPPLKGGVGPGNAFLVF